MAHIIACIVAYFILAFILLHIYGCYCVVRMIDKPVDYFLYLLKYGKLGLRIVAWIYVVILSPIIILCFGAAFMIKKLFQIT